MIGHGDFVSILTRWMQTGEVWGLFAGVTRVWSAARQLHAAREELHRAIRDHGPPDGNSPAAANPPT